MPIRPLFRGARDALAVLVAAAFGFPAIAVDTGIGISKRDLAVIFEEFRQAESDYSHKQEGTGLGLALSKRLVEQAFALLNGRNLMFCEDAGRRIQTALNADDRILDFWARCTHYESLHPHNAVSVITKGVKGGYVAGAGAPVRLDQLTI